MRLTMTALTLASLAFAAPAAFAQVTGDAAAGEKVFNKCQTCHVVEDADGNVLAGRNAKTGPNLYGMPGRVAGSKEGFRGYGDSLVALGETGFTWDEASFVEYAADPGKFLKARLDPKARTMMVYKLPKEQEAHDVWAFISSLSPEPAAAEGEATDAAATPDDAAAEEAPAAATN